MVFATLWLILSFLPHSPGCFSGGNAGRYLYLPAMGFSTLVADGVMLLDRLLAVVALAPRAEGGSVGAGRDGGGRPLHAVRGCERQEFRGTHRAACRRYITLFKQAKGDLPSHSRVSFDSPLGGKEGYRFLNALVQWEYRDPTIDLVPDQPDPR